jgi:hypothetical protein
MGSSDRARQRWRHALVVVEITVTIALLVETGGMINGYQRTMDADLGFDRRPLLALAVEDTRGLPLPQLLDVVRQVPGVAAASAASGVPFMGSTTRASVRAGDGGADTVADRTLALPGYFSTLGVPIREGRDFTAADRALNRIAIVNETLAAQLFPGRSALGGRVVDGEFPHEVVGVVSDYAHYPMQQRQIGRLILPLSSDAAVKRVEVVVRAAGDPGPLVETLRREVRRGVAGAMVAGAYTYDSVARVGAQELLVGTAPLVPLVAIGMLLTTAGIYGVLAFAIARRSRELAVRAAIGASSRDLLRLVSAHSARLVAIGVTCGIALTFGLSRIVRASGGAGSVYDPDWPAFVVPVAIVAVIGAVATLVPSRRVLRIDPAAILRSL